MRIRQHVQFTVKSERLTPAEITVLVGTEPDEAKVKGERRLGPPPSPWVHHWTLRSGIDEAASVEDHLAVLIPRLRDHATGLRAALAIDATEGWLFLGRTFEAGEEAFDERTYGVDAESEVGRLDGQHPFLGWGLDREVVALLASIGAGLDVDEYG